MTPVNVLAAISTQPICRRWRGGIQRNPRTVDCPQTNPPRADNSAHVPVRDEHDRPFLEPGGRAREDPVRSGRYLGRSLPARHRMGPQ